MEAATPSGVFCKQFELTMSRWKKTPSGWQRADGPVPEHKTDGPVPEQKKTEAAAPNLAAPTTGQLETPTPARGAPFEPPSIMPPTEEQAAKRAAAQLER